MSESSKQSKRNKRTQRETCARKRAYASETDAQRAAFLARGEYGWAMRTYLCPICGLWHTTMQTEWRPPFHLRTPYVLD